MSLAETQKQFKDHMLQPVKDLQAPTPSFKEKFISNGISVEERLKVYHNNIVGSLTEVLRACYPICENLTGGDFFKAMARAFIFENPPTGGCMHKYGEKLPGFIHRYKMAQPLPYLSDIATLEWALHHAYHANDRRPILGSHFTEITEHDLINLTLELRPSAHLISSAFPIAEIRSFCLSDGNEEDTPLPSINNNIRTYTLINRIQMDVEIVPLEDHEYGLLFLLNKGTPLGKALDTVISQYPDFDFTSFLQKHIELETFSDPDTNK